MKRRQGQKGFTLIEAMISIAIVGIISLVVVRLFSESLRAWIQGDTSLQAQYEVRTARDSILRVLRQAQANSIEIGQINPAQPRWSMISFVDAAGNSRYAYWQENDKFMQGRWAWSGTEWASKRVTVSARVLVKSDVNRVQFYYPNYKNFRNIQFVIYLYRPIHPGVRLKSPEIQMNGDLEIKNP